MQGVVRDWCSVILLVPLHTHGIRRHSSIVVVPGQGVITKAARLKPTKVGCGNHIQGWFPNRAVYHPPIEGS